MTAGQEEEHTYKRVDMLSIMCHGICMYGHFSALQIETKTTAQTTKECALAIVPQKYIKEGRK
jgi:hypothetical protein